MLVHRDSIPKYFWEPYIISGYRQPNTSLWQCVKYAFTLHNDVGNFWTHFTPAVAWPIWLYYLSYHLDLTDPYWYPLIAMIVGSSCYAMSSAMAHLFALKSYSTSLVLFMIDYHSITLGAAGGVIAYYHYSRMIGFFVFDYKWTLITLMIASCVSATIISSLSLFYWAKYRFIIRPLSFGPPFLLSFLTFLTRLVDCLMTGNQCMFDTLYHHALSFILISVAVLLYASRFPECLSPGRFDYFFHSHQLFHVLTTSTTSLQIYSLTIDAKNRQAFTASSESDPYLIPNFNCTVLPFLIVFVTGCMVVFVSLYFVYTGTLAYTTKKPLKKNY